MDTAGITAAGLQQVSGGTANTSILGQGSSSVPVGKKPRVRKTKSKGDGSGNAGADDASKRRCVSTACIACRRRKSKCDGNLPACAACSSVYNTECVYDPNSDHRRKGVYKKDIDKLKTRNSTLEVLVHALLNYQEEDVAPLVQQIRTCESLDAVAEAILAREAGLEEEDDELDDTDMQEPALGPNGNTFEGQLSGKMGQLQLEEGSTRYLGGTSNLIYLGNDHDDYGGGGAVTAGDQYLSKEEAIVSWTNVTNDPELVNHLLTMYFTWHYTYFTTLSRSAFYRDFLLGMPPSGSRKYCTPLLVNAMLALGCHFTSWPGARDDRDDSATAGDHFFREAKRLIMANDEHEHPRLTTVQALALMSVREAGCGREAKGWVYSGMSFRMACDLGLNLDSGTLSGSLESGLTDEEVDARRITFWGCFLFDKCWSNYLGRLPQLPPSIITTPKFEVFPMEESDIWAAYTDSGTNQSHAQPSRTRAVALQISALCEISSDLINNFYNPIDMDKSKGKQAELKKLSDIHQRLETWRRNLPQELEPKEGGLPSMLVMHMFFQLLYIHLFRPFLKYTQANSPLPPNVSPRRLCTQAAGMISKLMRLYKRSHGLRQICNIAVYILHTACTIHLLNLPDKNAKRDITHGVKHLEEIAEGWLCARRTLAILQILARKWKVDVPEEAAEVLKRTRVKYGAWGAETPRSPSVSASNERGESMSPGMMSPAHALFHPPQPGATIHPGQVPNYNPLAVTSSAGGVASVSVGASIHHSASDTYAAALPPTTVADMQARILATPASTHTTPNPNVPTTRGNSFDSTATPAGASPSALFGGVDQLLRDSQDWWLRDQNQLALGFEQWPMNEPDWASLQQQYSAAGPVSSPPVTHEQQPQQGPNGVGAVAYPAASSAGGSSSAAAQNGYAGLNGFGAAFGNGIGQYPEEHSWYS